MIASQHFAPSVPQEVGPPPLLKFSFLCFCVFNLAFYSRFFEWQLTWLHVPLVTSVIALAGAAMDGRLLTVFSSKIGICMALLTALYGVNVPLSSWKGASTTIFVGDWLKAVTAFAIAGAVIFNFRQCRTALYSIGWGSAVAGLLMNAKGQIVNGRLTLGRGTLGNSNEVAFDLLLGLPFLWLMFKDPRSGNLKKMLVVLLMLSSIVAMVRTGSRGGLIGFAVLCVLLFIRTSPAGKFAMAFSGILIILAGLLFLPNSLKVRYTTILSRSDAAEAAESAADVRFLNEATGSTTERRKLLMNSLKVTLTHPIFGCGIGQFGNYMAGIEQAQGVHSGWQGTHNTYTQISSEAGIPALIVFVTMIAFSIRGVRAVSKRAKGLGTRWQPVEDVINVSFALGATLAVYAVGATFDYIAYSAVLPLLVGLAIALIRSGNIELDRLQFAQTPQPNTKLVELTPIRTTRLVRPAF